MQMFVLLSRFQKPLDEVNRFLTSHSVWVQQHYESGHFLVSGRREPPIGGIIVARAESEQELREILAMDPLQQMGLVEYELFAFEPAVFPKRSSAFDAFAARQLNEYSSTQESGDLHTQE